MILEDYILVAVETIMPCDTKRAKRYKPFLMLKHTSREKTRQKNNTVHHDETHTNGHYMYASEKVSTLKTSDTYNHTSRVT